MNDTSRASSVVFAFKEAGRRCKWSLKATPGGVIELYMVVFSYRCLCSRSQETSSPIFTLQSSTDNLKQKTVCGQGSVFRTLDRLDKCCKMGLAGELEVQQDTVPEDLSSDGGEGNTKQDPIPYGWRRREEKLEWKK
ncbi:hypothetical protein INR49_014478 [Caranx melampygus]|nr:hypothetical protein INR49_014478 [Caranx melampygus]